MMWLIVLPPSVLLALWFGWEHLTKTYFCLRCNRGYMRYRPCAHGETYKAPGTGLGHARPR